MTDCFDLTPREPLSDEPTRHRPLPFDVANWLPTDPPDFREGERCFVRISGSTGAVTARRNIGSADRPIWQLLVSLDHGGRIWVCPDALERLIEPARKPVLAVAQRRPRHLRLVFSHGQRIG